MNAQETLDWREIAMFLLWDLMEWGDSGIEGKDYLLKETGLCEHEFALIENVYRDWMWTKNGALINQHWGDGQ